MTIRLPTSGLRSGFEAGFLPVGVRVSYEIGLQVLR